MATADGVTPRAIAFYLPQFHPIPENDDAWGAGFTEWSNVVAATPQFRQHHQPLLPADLGFYDLRVPEVRQAQADLATSHGIDAFCYHHYWFHGRRVLDRPLDEVLASGRPGIEFCLSWANEPWTRAWDGRTGEIVIEQRHSEDDDRAHGRWLARVFSDDRYLRLDGRPVFAVYKAHALPDPARTTDIWRKVCSDEGIGELFLLRVESVPHGDPRPLGFDASIEYPPNWDHLRGGRRRSVPWRLLRRAGVLRDAFARHRIHRYADLVARSMAADPPDYPRFPGVTPSWDNSARRAEDAVILRDASPEVYETWLDDAFRRARTQAPAPWVFINAWNEWAEGNVLEPTQLHGRAFLEATKRSVDRARDRHPEPTACR